MLHCFSSNPDGLTSIFLGQDMNERVLYYGVRVAYVLS